MTSDADREATLHAADDVYARQRRGTQQLLLARGVFYGSAYVAAAILTRQLGPASYGIYGVIISQLIWVEMVVNAGVPAATSKMMADGVHQPGAVARAAQTLLLASSLLVFLACWLLAPAIAAVMQIPDGAPLFRLAIVDLPFAAIYASYEGIFAGGRRFGVMAAAQVAYGLLRVGAIVAMAVVGLSIERALLATVFSSVAICAIMAVRYPPSGIRVEPATIKEIARFAGPMAICLIAGQVLVNLDLWSLQSLWTGGGDVIGHYVASVNLARLLAVIPTVQAGVLFASVARASAAHDNARAIRHIDQANRFAIIVAGGVSVILGANAAAVLSLLFSGAYAEGQRFLPLQLFGFSLFAVVDVFANALMAAGRQRLVAVVLTSIVPLVWAGNYLLIPRLGAVGAALSLVVGVAVGAIVTGIFTRLHFGAVHGWSTIVRVLIATVVVVLASSTVDVAGTMILVKLAALSVLYLLALYLLGEIKKEDWGWQAQPK
jgi:O-antigen/teichoic acid export membrane protein